MWFCYESGVVKVEERRYTLQIPPRSTGGHQFVYENEANDLIPGQPPGDLIFVIKPISANSTANETRTNVATKSSLEREKARRSIIDKRNAARRAEIEAIVGSLPRVGANRFVINVEKIQ
jgi:hypothetical protein